MTEAAYRRAVFQSPDGDSLCPDLLTLGKMQQVGDAFQSPDGDSLCPDQIYTVLVNVGETTFQSPDGDSLCPDLPIIVHVH